MKLWNRAQYPRDPKRTKQDNVRVAPVERPGKKLVAFAAAPSCMLAKINDLDDMGVVPRLNPLPGRKQRKNLCIPRGIWQNVLTTKNDLKEFFSIGDNQCATATKVGKRLAAKFKYDPSEFTGVRLDLTGAGEDDDLPDPHPGIMVDPQDGGAAAADAAGTTPAGDAAAAGTSPQDVLATETNSAPANTPGSGGTNDVDMGDAEEKPLPPPPTRDEQANGSTAHDGPPATTTTTAGTTTTTTAGTTGTTNGGTGPSPSPVDCSESNSGREEKQEAEEEEELLVPGQDEGEMSAPDFVEEFESEDESEDEDDGSPSGGQRGGSSGAAAASSSGGVLYVVVRINMLSPVGCVELVEGQSMSGEGRRTRGPGCLGRGGGDEEGGGRDEEGTRRGGGGDEEGGTRGGRGGDEGGTRGMGESDIASSVPRTFSHDVILTLYSWRRG